MNDFAFQLGRKVILAKSANFLLGGAERLVPKILPAAGRFIGRAAGKLEPYVKNLFQRAITFGKDTPKTLMPKFLRPLEEGVSSRLAAKGGLRGMLGKVPKGDVVASTGVPGSQAWWAYRYPKVSLGAGAGFYGLNKRFGNGGGSSVVPQQSGFSNYNSYEDGGAAPGGGYENDLIQYIIQQQMAQQGYGGYPEGTQDGYPGGQSNNDAYLQIIRMLINQQRGNGGYANSGRNVAGGSSFIAPFENR